MGFERVVDQVRPLHVPGRVKALDVGQSFRLTNTLVGQRDVVLFFVDREVLFLAKRSRDLVGVGVASQVHVARSADDQRRPRFVDQDVVDFVNDRVVERTLTLLRFGRESVVPLRGRTHVVA